MRFLFRAAAVLATWFAITPAFALFHLWQMNELYSNADGTVQFLEMTSLTGSQEFVRGHTLRSTSGSSSNTFTFPNDLPGDSGGRRMLIGTQGFAALGVVTPDFVVPNGFFHRNGGTINFAESSDVWNHGALPAPPASLNRDGSTATNSPRNFQGATGSIGSSTPPPPPPPPPTFNVQALWWRSPAGSENGWGLNVTHQGDTLFATWFTYDVDGSGMWLSSDLHKEGANEYAGTVYQTRGSPFSATPYDNSRFVPNAVGTARLVFSDRNTGTFNYSVKGVSQAKPITRFVYSSPVPICAQNASPSGAPNYEDLWWRSPAGSENGWGVNISHQGDILFATWFTYGPDGTDMWMVMSDGRKTADRTYTGQIHRTTSAPFSAYDASRFTPTLVGSGTFTFTDNNNGTFSYTIDGITQSKPITRFVFGSPTTTCNFVTAEVDDPMPDPYPD